MTIELIMDNNELIHMIIIYIYLYFILIN